ncbi:hypothetical protein Bbelb_129820 [Branchiostoma belcheri]|nr:hypothetical protein Bbelb_129820 [Branchiostoma belcheri]
MTNDEQRFFTPTPTVSKRMTGFEITSTNDFGEQGRTTPSPEPTYTYLATFSTSTQDPLQTTYVTDDREQQQQGSTWLRGFADWVIDATPAKDPHYRRHHGPDKVLDSNYGTYWNPYPPKIWGPWYIAFDFQAPYTLSKISITNFGDVTHDVTAFRFQRSTTRKPDRHWTDVLRVTSAPVTGTTPQEFGGFSAVSRFWRLLITKTGRYGAWQPCIREV